MTPSEIDAYHRGRADLMVAIARRLGWSDGKLFGFAKPHELTPSDIRAAISRADAYVEETP